MTVEYCTACDRKFTFTEVSKPNLTDEGTGPYCDPCWFFVREIQGLHNRITVLEEK